MPVGHVGLPLPSFVARSVGSGETNTSPAGGPRIGTPAAARMLRSMPYQNDPSAAARSAGSPARNDIRGPVLSSISKPGAGSPAAAISAR